MGSLCVMINPLDVVLKQLNTEGVSVEVKRQRSDGVLEPTKPSELASLGTKSRLAHTANLLSNLTPKEKIEWALEMKDQANDFYRQQNYTDAMHTYVEALTASSFGANEADNTDSLVVPVLCNLAACCLQLGEWMKAVQFCDQAIKLRSKCPKAHLRRAIACLKLNEFEDALVSILSCQSNVEVSSSTTAEDLDTVVEATTSSQSQDPTAPSLELSESDKKKLSTLLYQARTGIKQNKERFERQKAGLRKAFASEPKKTNSTIKENTSSKEVIGSNTNRTLFQWFMKLVLVLLEFVLMILKYIFRVKDTPKVDKSE